MMTGKLERAWGLEGGAVELQQYVYIFGHENVMDLG